MRDPISDDCTGDPPGELINSATADGLPFLKARSNTGPIARSFKLPRPDAEIIPDRRTVETVGFLGKKGNFIMLHDLDTLAPRNKDLCRIYSNYFCDDAEMRRSGPAHGIDHQLHIIWVCIRCDAMAKVENMWSLGQGLHNAAGFIDQFLTARHHVMRC